ncbi:MAG: OmpA family protein [Bacteroidia bacterium]
MSQFAKRQLEKEIIMWKYFVSMASMLSAFLFAPAQVTNSHEEDLPQARQCAKNIPEWQRMLEIKPSPGLMEDLADCYACIQDHSSAVNWYQQSLDAGNSHIDCRRKLALSLQKIGEFDQAIVEMRRYANRVGASTDTESFMDACATMIQNRYKGGRFQVEHIPALSTRQSEIPACRHQGDLYFYSRAPRSRLGRENYKGSQGRPYSLYCVPLHAIGKRSAIRVVSKMSCPRDKFLGLVWDQSCSDYYIVKAEKREDGENPPGIFRSWIDYHGQVHEEKMYFNGEAPTHSNFHPAIDRTGHYIVFASDREGGFGGIDLYYCFRQHDTWSEPVNLGPLVNTVRDETFPSFSAGGVLYFASDGYPGFGGMDVYSTELTPDGWSAAINVGAEINSQYDDFGLVWNPDPRDHSGYFCSDRLGDRRCELYSFSRPPEIMGRVVDALTGAALPNVSLTLTSPGVESISLASAEDGSYSAFLDPDRTYTLAASLAGYDLDEWVIEGARIGQGADCRLEVPLTPYGSYTIAGKVLDHEGQFPMENVSLRVIQARTGEELRYESITGGEYSVTLGVGEDYALLFKSPGYNSYAVPLQLTQSHERRSESHDVRMRRGDQVLLVGMVTDAEGKRLEGVSRLDVMNMKTKALLRSIETDRQGNFSLWIDRNWVGEYALFASHVGHSSTHVHIVTDDDKFFPFQLNAQNLTMEFASAALHHDFGKKEVAANSMEVLDDVYMFLLQNPNVSMELRTYADARGSATDNAALSEQRALAILNDLLMRGGISSDRLHHAHFGESRPKNGCVDGVDCPEEQHAENRRTEVYFFQTPAPRASN